MECEKIQVIDCGLLEYDQTLGLQIEFWQNLQKEKTGNTVLLVEHPDVITLGARNTENKLLASGKQLKQKGIELHRIGRGGGTTAHNPGQIVMYPMINLKSIGSDVPAYVRSLESIGIELLDELGVQSQRRKGYPGLWVGEKKIASIGVQIKKWITMHGMAINIQNDLGIFDYIIPCGIEGVVMTSVLNETGIEQSIEEIKHTLTELCFKQWG